MMFEGTVNKDRSEKILMNSTIQTKDSEGALKRQLIQIPGLPEVHFCKESYIMLVVWSVIGIAFYAMQRPFFDTGK